jgi:hypothetical protein
MAKLDARLELRLDKQTVTQLERRAARDNVSIGEFVRRAIARELGGDNRSWRLQAVEAGLKLNMPVPDDPVELCRELEATYETAEPALPRTGRRPRVG